MTIVPLRPEEEEDPDMSLDTAGLPRGKDDTLTIPFQNENLYAILSSPGKEDKARDHNLVLVRVLKHFIYRSWSRYPT